MAKDVTTAGMAISKNNRPAAYGRAANNDVAARLDVYQASNE